MMSTFPKSRAAAGYIARHARGELARARAAVLLTRLDACEDVPAGGDVPAVLHGLLRDLVLAARDLAGPAWLAAASDDPDIAAFSALQATPVPPSPAELDDIISRVLWSRFAPPGTRATAPGTTSQSAAMCRPLRAASDPPAGQAPRPRISRQEAGKPDPAPFRKAVEDMTGDGHTHAARPGPGPEPRGERGTSAGRENRARPPAGPGRHSWIPGDRVAAVPARRAVRDAGDFQTVAREALPDQHLRPRHANRRHAQHRTHHRADADLANLIAALSPSNVPLVNPSSAKAVIDTDGLSLVRGGRARCLMARQRQH
jgi:hypothetical protein